MAGPLATIWDVYQKGALTKSVSPPVWVVLIGALGLVIGLATYGEADKACEDTSICNAWVVVTHGWPAGNTWEELCGHAACCQYSLHAVPQLAWPCVLM